MPTITKISFDDLLLEADLAATLEEIDSLCDHIRNNVPHELLFTESGQPNVRLQWGAILFHAETLRCTLRAFL